MSNENSLKKIDKIMSDFISELGYSVADEMFSHVSSGKKLRSKLLLSIAGDSDNSLKICAIIELIHLASLLHDDVIDDADTRRGKPSINALFGTKDAVMLGDILYSKAFYELSKIGTQISSIISDAVVKLSIGELMDVRLGKSFNDNSKKYMQMIYYKTAILIEATARCGAILAGYNEDKFGIYGRNLGLAFQIIDDVLDITQDSIKLGKPSLNDYKEGKTTLPYIHLYENLNNDDKKILMSYHLKELNDNQKAWIKQKFTEFKSIEISIQNAKNLGKEAIEAISEYENEKLKDIIVSMIDREF